jgi:hypothetical protein
MRRKLLIFRNTAIPYPGARVWRAAINSDVDGDTLWVERDTGCDQSQLVEIRLVAANGMDRDIRGFDADERFTPGGILVTAEVKRLIPDYTVVRIETEVDPEKFGRWVSPILIRASDIRSDFKENVPSECFTERYESPAPFGPTALYLDLASYLRWKFPDYTRWRSYT